MLCKTLYFIVILRTRYTKRKLTKTKRTHADKMIEKSVSIFFILVTLMCLQFGHVTSDVTTEDQEIEFAKSVIRGMEKRMVEKIHEKYTKEKSRRQANEGWGKVKTLLKDFMKTVKKSSTSDKGPRRIPHREILDLLDEEEAHRIPHRKIPDESRIPNKDTPNREVHGENDAPRIPHRELQDAPRIPHKDTPNRELQGEKNVPRIPHREIQDAPRIPHREIIVAPVKVALHREIQGEKDVPRIPHREILNNPRIPHREILDAPRIPHKDAPRIPHMDAPRIPHKDAVETELNKLEERLLHEIVSRSYADEEKQDKNTICHSECSGTFYVCLNRIIQIDVASHIIKCTRERRQCLISHPQCS